MKNVLTCKPILSSHDDSVLTWEGMSETIICEMHLRPRIVRRKLGEIVNYAAEYAVVERLSLMSVFWHWQLSMVVNFRI